MAGWQDAVANLQSQINTINSQISSLSGQEATNTSAINSLQTQVAAIQAEITSLLQSAPFGDYSGQIAVQINPLVSPATFSLTQGGYAAVPLSLSEIDGKLIRVHSAGVVTFDQNFPAQSCNYFVELGDPTNPGAPLVGLGGGVVASPLPYLYREFITDKTFLYSSTSGNIFVFADSSVDGFLSGSPTPVSLPSSFSIFPAAYFSNVSGTSTAKISVTDFRVTLL